MNNKMIRKGKISNDRLKGKKRIGFRQRNMARFQIPAGTQFDYKDVPMLQKFLNDRGKIVPRRISGISAKSQRQLACAIKRARFLALLITGGVKK